MQTAGAGSFTIFDDGAGRLALERSGASSRRTTTVASAETASGGPETIEDTVCCRVLAQQLSSFYSKTAGNMRYFLCAETFVKGCCGRCTETQRNRGRDTTN
jgi:hypothetical protein